MKEGDFWIMVAQLLADRLAHSNSYCPCDIGRVGECREFDNSGFQGTNGKCAKEWLHWAAIEVRQKQENKQ